MNNNFKEGIRDGIPIFLGYFTVSFAFGILCATNGLPAWLAVLISMTNVTSAGQFAGLTLMLSSASFFEMAVTQFTINLRYALMSLSLSQKLYSTVNLPQRMFIAFCNTDEIFATSSSKQGTVNTYYMYGLMLLPYIGWALGTLSGAVAGEILPQSVQTALSISLYGMFLAIIIPPAKKSRSVTVVVMLSIGMSCAFYYIPFLKTVSSGFVIIISAVISSLAGALLFPLKDENVED